MNGGMAGIRRIARVISKVVKSELLLLRGISALLSKYLIEYRDLKIIERLMPAIVRI